MHALNRLIQNTCLFFFKNTGDWNSNPEEKENLARPRGQKCQQLETQRTPPSLAFNKLLYGTWYRSVLSYTVQPPSSYHHNHSEIYYWLWAFGEKSVWKRGEKKMAFANPPRVNSFVHDHEVSPLFFQYSAIHNELLNHCEFFRSIYQSWIGRLFHSFSS